MKLKLVYALLAFSILLMGGGIAQAGILIDGFTTNQSMMVGGPPAGNQTAFSTISAAEAIGGVRDITLNRTLPSGNGFIVGDVNLSMNGTLSYSSGSNTTGNALVVWDGPDGGNPAL